MFETFGVAGFYISVEANLSLYGNGKSTALVCDAGDDIIYYVPIYNGYIFPHAVLRTNFAGRELNEILCKMLSNSEMTFATQDEKEIIKDIKEKYCYVKVDFKEEEKKT